MLVDLHKTGVSLDFLDEVSQALSPGKAVLADTEEAWAAPMDTKIGELRVLVLRRLRSEVIEDQLARESAAFDAELQQLEDELAQRRAQSGGAKANRGAQDQDWAIRAQMEARIAQLKTDTDAKIAAPAGAATTG